MCTNGIAVQSTIDQTIHQMPIILFYASDITMEQKKITLRNNQKRNIGST